MQGVFYISYTFLVRNMFNSGSPIYIGRKIKNIFQIGVDNSLARCYNHLRRKRRAFSRGLFVGLKKGPNAWKINALIPQSADVPKLNKTVLCVVYKGGKFMEDFSFLLTIAIIILSTRFLGEASEKVNMPQVVGALIAGVILGPSVLGLVSETDFLSKTAEIGVILLMFIAGLDTDLQEIKKNAVAFVVIASCGVLVPLIGGFATYYFYFDVDPGNFNEVLKAVFMGVVLTATSVSITVEALREMGKLNGPVGSAILGAAVLDDIIGIIILTIVTSMKDTSVSIGVVFLKIGLYIIAMGTMAFIMDKLKDQLDKGAGQRRISIYVMALVLIVSYASEKFFGIADITGAYLVGVMLSTFKARTDIARKMTVPSYLFFSPIFFASIGIKTELDGMTKSFLIFSILLLIVAVISKIIGCGLGAKLCGYSADDSFHIGIGMVSRGEVALIVAQKGYSLGLLGGDLFSPIVLVVIITTIITPVLLKKLMK